MSRSLLRIVLVVLAATMCAAPAVGQVVEPTSDPGVNPLVVVDGAVQLLPGEKPKLSTTINILVMMTVLSLAPSILIMCTCFTRFIIVLGLLRQALGTQGLPPSQVIIGLSLFLSFAAMAPTIERIYDEAVKPYADGEITDYDVAWDKARQPLRDFMFAQIEASGNWSGVYMMLNYRGIDTSDPASLTREDVDMVSLIPAFILSELKVAFLMGFRIYLPFLVIDMVIASLLISMGMLMLPPVLISLPFKLLLFVMVDGWQLIVGSLLMSVTQPDPTMVAFVLTSGAHVT
ncbi:MAG: flagellar type III secretion system pore protein FliP [Planctomycetota bacterium]